MASTLLEKAVEAQSYLVDPKCPLFRQRYSLAEAKVEAKINAARWRALYGPESIEAGILLAESREAGNYLRGQSACAWLSKNHPLYQLRGEARHAANLYFSDRGAVEEGKRVYDPERNCFFQAEQIKQQLMSSFKPLSRDIAAYLYPGEGYPLLSFDNRAGQEVLIPLGTPVLFFGPYKHEDEEILLRPEARLQSACFLHPSSFSEKMKACVEKKGEGFTFSLHEL